MVKKTVEKCDKPTDTKRRRSPRSLPEIVKKEDIVKDYDASTEKREQHDKHMAEYRKCLPEICEMSLKIPEKNRREEFVDNYVEMAIGSNDQCSPSKVFKEMQNKLDTILAEPKQDKAETVVEEMPDIQISNISPSEASMMWTEIPIENIIPDPNQPRKMFDEAKQKELVESIKQHGLLQPILVRPIGDKFQIVHGERRYRACKVLGLEKIRAEVKELSDRQVLEIQLVENLQREDLNPIEEAETFQRMISECGYKHEEIAQRIGKSREYVTKRLRLLDLPLATQDKIGKRELTASLAEVILSVDEPEKAEKVTNAIIEDNLTVRQAKDLVESVINPEANVLRRTFDVSEDGLVIGIWVSNETLQVLSESASSKNTTVEGLCKTIIEEAAKNCQ